MCTINGMTFRESSCIFSLRMLSSYFSYVAVEMRLLWGYLCKESSIVNGIQDCVF